MLPPTQEIQRQPSDGSTISFSDLLTEPIDDIIKAYNEPEDNGTLLGKRKSTQKVGSLPGSPPYKRARRSVSPCESLASPLFDNAESSSSASSAPTSQEELDLLRDPYIIAQPGLPLLLRLRTLSWGVQWEICRLLGMDGKISWSRVNVVLGNLRGNHKEIAPHVGDILATGKKAGTMQQTRELTARAPWEELDREMLALDVDECACMGHMNTAPGLKDKIPEDWYGGQVQFAAKLTLVAKSKPPKLQLSLLPPELGSSSRFTRRFGSDFLIRVRVHKDIFRNVESVNHLEDLLLRPFVLCGRVYRFFYANKERTAFLMATNETYPRVLAAPELARRLSFLQFMEWHNPMAKNCNQTMAKYCARTALGLSNSVPGGVFDASDIVNIEEIQSEMFSGDGKIPSEMEMTDGCGFVNLAVGHYLCAKGICKDPPTAIQIRLRGAKGLLIRHPDPSFNKSDAFAAWLRPSQDKIRHSPKTLFDVAHRSLDLLRVSHMRSPIRLSKEMIINLAENGVNHKAFENLMKMQLQEAIAGLIDWTGEDAMYRLWVAVEKEGHVITARMARENSGTARVRGLRAYDKEDDDSSDEDDDEIGTSGIMADVQRERSAAWWGDEISGCPSSLEETVMEFLDSGFRPDNNPVLAGKLHEVVKKAVKSHVSKYRLYIPMSCSAFIVPDPFGVLEEGEIHVKSSSRNLLLPDRRMSDKITGDVLVTRNPCKLPTDVQKVKAVFRAELDDYVDVVVFSIKGSRSLASLLAGGDYDGDKVDVIWQPEIVEKFTNSDRKYADPPVDLRKSFKEENKQVVDFMKDVPGTAPSLERTTALQRFLLVPLRNIQAVGTYSAMHDNAMYRLGYSHPETLRLAWMFCTVLDGTKTGLAVEPDVFRKDKKEFWAGQMPFWKRAVSGTENSSDVYLRRPKTLGVFVMDHMEEAICKAKDEQLARVEAHFNKLPPPTIDEDLLKPYQEALALAGDRGPRRDEFSLIEQHVTNMFHLHKKEMATFASRYGKNTFTELSIEKRQDVIRSISRKFADVPAPGTLKHWTNRDARLIRASLAYSLSWAKSNGKAERFPWDVAMRDLCDIKLEDMPHKTVKMVFYDRYKVSRQGFAPTK
ncbi:RNA dependent RNA polymerase-domain-containing protein [Amylostereum chailletii]|nr:RNA dependent RNA polymerase-domain-containing protein [Amylostereum chailletii]